MKKLFLVLVVFSIFAINVSAQEEVATEGDKADIYLLLNPGVLIPESFYGVSLFDPSFTGGLVAGFQINKNFAIDISLMYQGLSYKYATGLYNGFDVRLYTLYQPVIPITQNIKLMPNVGAGVIYSYHNSLGYGIADMFGIAAKAGMRVTYKQLIGGVSVDYAYKGGLTGGASVNFEVGIFFDN